MDSITPRRLAPDGLMALFFVNYDSLCQEMVSSYGYMGPFRVLSYGTVRFDKNIKIGYGPYARFSIPIAY